MVHSIMLPLVSGINSRLLSVNRMVDARPCNVIDMLRRVRNRRTIIIIIINHALISPILTRPGLLVALPPSAALTHHYHYPSPLHSFIPGLKPSFSANDSHRSFSFLLPD